MMMIKIGISRNALFDNKTVLKSDAQAVKYTCRESL